MLDMIDQPSAYAGDHAALLFQADIDAGLDKTGPGQDGQGFSFAHSGLDAFLFSSSSLTAPGTGESHAGARALATEFADYEDLRGFREGNQNDKAEAAAFNPKKFKLHPADLEGDAETLATAIIDGLKPAKALALLEKAAAKARVSFDQMLLLTEAELDLMEGSRSDAGRIAFGSAMEQQLSSGDASADLAALVKSGKLTGAAAADIIVEMAHIATPGANLEAHALARLLDKMDILNVAESQNEAATAAHASLILDGVEMQIQLGGVNAPRAVDLRAAAEVMEFYLGDFSETALFDLKLPFIDLDDTAAERAFVRKVEVAALAEARSEQQLTQTEANAWAAAFDTFRPDGYSKRVYQLASAYADGELTSFEVAQALDNLASKYFVETGIHILPDTLIAKASGYVMSDVLAGNMARFADLSFTVNGQLGSTELGQVLDRLVDEVTTVRPGEEANAAAMLEVVRIATGYQFLAEDDLRAAFADAREAAGDNFIPWAVEVIDAMGGRGGIGSTNASIKVFLALAEQMADLLASGELADYAAAEVESGNLTVVEAVDFVMNFATLAVDNMGSVDYGSEGNQWGNDLASLKQRDGVQDIDRASLALVQLVKTLTGENAEIARLYAIDSHVQSYLAGLGSYAMIEGGDAMVQSIIEARAVIKQTVTVSIAEFSKTNPTNIELMAAAEGQTDTLSATYLSGITVVGAAASLALGENAPLGLGSLGAVAAYASDPSLDGFVQLGVEVVRDGLDIANPLEKAQLIADVSEILLNKFGVAEIIGPFLADVVQGAVDVVQAVSNSINAAINSVVGAVVETAVQGGIVIVEAAQNFGDFVADLAVGNWDGVLSAAERFATDFATGVFNLVVDIPGTIEQAIDGIIAAAEELIEAAKDALLAIQAVFDAIADALDTFLGWIFGT